MFQYLSRYKFVKIVSFFSIIVLLGFTALRVYTEAYIYAYIDFFIAVMLGFNLWILIKKNSLILASYILISFISVLALLLYYSGGIENTGNIPLLAIPLFVYFVFGKKIADIWMIVFTLLFVILSYLFLSGILSNPYTSGVIRQTSIFYIIITWVAYMFESLNYKSQMQIIKQAESLKAYNYELTCSIDQKTQAIKEMHDSIESTIALEVKRKKTKDQIYFQQSQQKKIAEMLAMVSDQWREPLSYIASIISNTRLVLDKDQMNESYIVESLENVDRALQELTDIIESFHAFYQPNTEKEYFYIHLSIKNALMMMEKRLQQANIDLNIWLDDGLEVIGFRSEFEQVILNLLGNAKRELKKQDIESPWMQIIVKEELIDGVSFASIIVRDNGAGIKEEDLENIFTANMQTHNQEDSDIGLYMSKEIIEGHMHGTITAENYKEEIEGNSRSGAKFEITLPLVVRNR